MRVRNRNLLVGVAVACLTMTVAGCGGSDDDKSDSSGSRTINTEFVANPTSFDPALAKARDDYNMGSLMFDTLVHNDDDAKLVGDLATKWSAESTSKYVFTIRTDATCADGTKITPTVVADSLKYLADASTGDHVAAPLVFGPGAPTITADDAAGTVTVQTAAPYVNLINGMAAPQSGIICPAGLKDKAGLKAGTVKGAFSGPYTLGEAKSGISYSFDLRKDYKTWPQFATPLKGEAPSKIVFSQVTDDATSANKMLSGDLDMVLLGGETVDRFKDSGDKYNQTNITYANGYVMFNERPGHYFSDNQPARQAVAKAIDCEAFNKVFSNRVGPLMNSVVPDTYACVNTDETLIEKTDPAAAAAVLKGATIKIVASTSFGNQGRAAEYIQQVLTAAGAKVELKKTDNAAWATVINDPKGDWDLTIQGDLNVMKVISASLDRVMGPAIEDSGRNIPGNDNAEGAAALKAGLSTNDPAEQCRQYQIAQESMLKRDDVVPMAGIAWAMITAKDVTVRAPNGTIGYSTIRIS